MTNDTELDALVKRLENVSLQVGFPSRTILDSAVIRQAIDTITTLRAQLADAMETWPLWASQIKAKLESYGVDPGDEWNVAEQFEMWVEAVGQFESDRADRAEAERDAAQAALAAQIEAAAGIADAFDLGATEKYILEFLAYDPDTGVLTWRPRHRGCFNSDNEFGRWNTRYASKPAGGFDGHKYIQVRVNGKKELAHRVAWFLSYGEWPSDQIDHINGDRSDNRLSNLRVVSCAENAKNRGMTTQNSSGIVGVTWNDSKKVWQAQIKVDRDQIHLGTFADFQSAVIARRTAEEQHGFHPNHGRHDRTALDRMLRAEREKALREAADRVEDYCSDMPDLAGHGHSVGLKDAILAMVKQPEIGSGGKP